MTESHAHRDSSFPYRRVGKIGAAVFLLVAGLYLAASVIVQTFYGADFVEMRLNRALPGEMASQSRVEVGTARWSLWRRSLTIGHVTLYPIETDSGRAASSTPRYTGLLSHLSLRGLHLWPLLWNDTFRFDEVTIRRPVLYVERGRTDRAGQTASDETIDFAAVGGSALVDHLPTIDVRRLRVRKGVIVCSSRPNEASAPSVRDLLWGLSLTATGVRTDAASLRDSSRILLSDSVRTSIDGYHRLSADSLYATRVGPVAASSADSSFLAQDVHVGPTVADATFMQRRGHRTNRLSASALRVDVQGMDYRRFLRQRSVLARTIRLDSLHVDVYRNNKYPPPPTDPPPKMPHEIIRSLQQTVRIDTITVTDGYARYAKWHEEGGSPGTIFFDEINATIRNVTNDPRLMSPSTPAVIDATTRVAGAGRLKTTIRVPLRSSHLALAYEGQLGPMDARAFNDAFVPLSGIRIEDGHVDSLWFRAEVAHGQAHGTLHGMYRDLDVEMLDKGTGERGIGKRIRTFVLDDLMLKSHNTRDDSPLRTGTIEHEYEKGDTFLKFLWHSTRSGLVSLIGM